MSIASIPKPSLMTVPEFLGFLRSRPDEERWELIGGIPMMMAPPSIRHQRIASNLERLLNDALRERRPEWRADRDIRLVIEASGYYRPDPEIAVIDGDLDEEESFASRFYLAVEVLSPSDEAIYDQSGKRVIDVKLALYQSHVHSRCIMLVRQDRLEIALHLRHADGTWSGEPATLNSPTDVIEIDGIGRLSMLAEAYAGTSLEPRLS
jgi:Uma2 family endonuclease